jgi:hypothetical protein
MREQFHTVVKAIGGQVVRGVAFTPGTPLTNEGGNDPRPQPFVAVFPPATLPER